MIYIDEKKSTPLYEQIYFEIRNLILEGELANGEKLKAIRTLANELGVSNNTVSKAYQSLIDDGYINSSHGSGHYVCWNSSDMDQTDIFYKPQKVSEIYDFTLGPMDASLFPWSKWKYYLTQAIINEKDEKVIDYEDKKGSILLRKELCSYVYKERGIKCDPEQMIICAGKQYAMDIIFEILPEAYRRILVENPCVKRMEDFFEYKKMEIHRVNTSVNGIDLETLEKSHCNLLYVTPSHNFPYGYTTSYEKRKRISAWANENDSYVIEDDFESEFFYNQEIVPAIHSLNQEDRVIYMHTYARVLSPSLRCTFLILPKSLMKIYEKRFQGYYTAIPIHNQNALAEFIHDGHLTKQISKTKKHNYREYHELNDLFADILASEYKICNVSSYSHLVIRIPDSIKDFNAFLKAMLEKGYRLEGIEDSETSQKIIVVGIPTIEKEKFEEVYKRFCLEMNYYLWNKL